MPSRPSHSSGGEGATYLGSKVVYPDEPFIDDYLEWVLSWWRGRRAAQGVLGDVSRRCQ